MSSAIDEHSEPRPRLQLRLQLLCGPADGACSIPLDRIHQVTGFARLAGTPEEYFAGWLTLHGETVPVFDLNRMVCDRSTPESFGSRILILAAKPGSPTRWLGLLASGVTDTLALDEAEPPPPLELDSYLPMLYTLIPPLPVCV